MSKKLYHLPLKKIDIFIKKEKNTIIKSIKNSKKLEYSKYFGKASYLLEIERFILFFKIEKNLDYALKLINYFKSDNFLVELINIMNLKSFCEGKKEHLYLILYYLKAYESELFKGFLQQSFMHFYTTQTESRKEDLIGLIKALAKIKKINMKESFGEVGNEAYFKIIVDGKILVDEKGKSIKKLKKYAYLEFLKLLKY